MPPKKDLKVALVGNPNAGKTSLFNQLTGLNQKVGNFPGVTVDKKVGSCLLPNGKKAQVIDLPGTYSITPKSLDEHIVYQNLLHIKEDQPDVVLVIVDETNLKRNLLLFTQIIDLEIPVVLALNMVELAKKTGVIVDPVLFEQEMGVPVVEINARAGRGIPRLKQVLSEPIALPKVKVFDPVIYSSEIIGVVKKDFELENDYRAYLHLINYENFDSFSDGQRSRLKKLTTQYEFNSKAIQTTETLERYHFIDQLIKKVKKEIKVKKASVLTEKLDNIFAHKIWGYVIFTLILFLIFQFIFKVAEWPMNFIDQSVADFGNWLSGIFPKGPFFELITEGVIAGVGGILIFIPQITLLFLIISILEETGYMSRVMFLMDKFMRKLGMNGRSVVPLVSSLACAVPAIMATRTIRNWKERLITIFTAPLMSCSARLPVYIILIALVVPNKTIWGVFNLQGLALLGMYLLGFVAMIGSAMLMKLFLKTKEKSYFVLELPDYRIPQWSNVGKEVYQKVKTFVLDAGKVILIISIIIWVLQSYGPGNDMEAAKSQVLSEYGYLEGQEIPDDVQAIIDSRMLEESYVGKFGRGIEPAIAPLGYDWKIGIALITSFAAREVFVGTISVIYSAGDEEDESTIRKRLKSVKNPTTGEPVFTLPVAFSLLIFYAFAMQCMSTVAVVYKETGGWKWPVIQVFYMTGLAYLASFITFNLLN